MEEVLFDVGHRGRAQQKGTLLMGGRSNIDVWDHKAGNDAPDFSLTKIYTNGQLTINMRVLASPGEE